MPPDFEILVGDALSVLQSLPDQSIQMVCTSPPYFGLRNYGTATWEGGEPSCLHEMSRNKNRHKEGDKSATNKGSNPITWNVCGSCGARRIDQQIGLEETPEKYVAKLVEVFREVRRVLKDDGTVWLNLGDSYSGTGYGTGTGNFENKNNPSTMIHKKGGVIPAKNLIGTPWRVAFAL